MKYKRLTKKGLENGEIHFVLDKNNKVIVDRKLFEEAIKIHKRLAELEDKIEQGTLVDTESYFIVEENQWAGKNRYLVCQNAVQLAVCDFCESREEAEKKIKELQE